jgi:Domain of unknown function (DUF4136)
MVKHRSLRRPLAFIATCLVAAAQIVVAGQQPKYGTTVLVAKAAVLRNAKTYMWTPSQPSFDKTVDRQIVAAVDRELTRLGFTKLASGQSDVLVTYGSLTRTDVDLKSKPAKDGARREYPVGTLVVSLLAPSNRQPLFRVRIDTPIDADRAQLEPAINAAVAAMFEKYSEGEVSGK